MIEYSRVGTARSYTTRNGSAVDVMLEIPNDPP